MDFLQEMLEAFREPQTRHAAVVHLPVALSLVCVLLAIAAAAGGRRVTLRWVAIVGFGLLAFSAYYATFSGEDADAALPGDLQAAIYDVVNSHEHKANWIWQFAVGAMLIQIVALLPRVRLLAGLAGVAGALFIAGWTAYVGHLGGTLVYGHGVGTAAFELTTDGETETPAIAMAAPTDQRAAFFLAEVRPLLETHCVRCHNPGRPRAGLDQTSIAAMLEGGVSGPAVVPGRPEASLLVAAMRHQDGLEMPVNADPLPEASIVLVERWIREGAVWAEPATASE